MTSLSRTHLAGTAARITGRVARLIPRFQGQTLPGRVALALDPGFLGHRVQGRAIALVTGTNGKTTTTAFLRSLLSPDVVSNRGSNLPWGIAAALAGERTPRRFGVFEVDEAYVPSVARSLAPSVLVWLNMSRDQLDRNLEVRRLAARIGEASQAIVTLVANASDPLIVANAGGFSRCVWIKGPLEWHGDAQSCPRCTGELRFGERWICSVCGLCEPDAAYSVDDGGRVFHGEQLLGELHPGLPGGFNLMNALAATVAVSLLRGQALEQLIGDLDLSTGVDGRFSRWWLTGCDAQPLMVTFLAKNPAGWHANLGMVDFTSSELVLGLNARIADGRDTSWIWDVEFEELGARSAIVTGERAADLAFRLEVADLAVEVVPSQIRAVQLAAKRLERDSAQRIVYLGNYTAFRALIGARDELGAVLDLQGDVSV